MNSCVVFCRSWTEDKRIRTYFSPEKLEVCQELEAIHD